MYVCVLGSTIEVTNGYTCTIHRCSPSCGIVSKGKLASRQVDIDYKLESKENR